MIIEGNILTNIGFLFNRFFENFILLSILLNSILLALYDYSDRDSLTEYNQILDKIGMAFTGIFTMEFVLKTIALGFILHKKAYLRSGWNLIDFTVVMSG